MLGLVLCQKILQVGLKLGLTPGQLGPAVGGFRIGSVLGHLNNFLIVLLCQVAELRSIGSAHVTQAAGFRNQCLLLFMERRQPPHQRL